MRWEPAIARARGLATHLLRKEDLLRLIDAGSWLAAARRAVDAGYPANPGAALASPAEFDREIGRVVGSRIETLARWVMPGRGALALIYEDLDRRNIASLLQSAAEGASFATRLGATTPTPNLPERSLELLARADSPAMVAAGLVRLGHPAGRALLQALSPRRPLASGQPGLFAIELLLGQIFAVRARRAVRRAGRTVRQLVAWRIDLDNAWSVLAADGWMDSVSPEAAFVPGGVALGADRFRQVAGWRDPGRALPALREAFAGTPFEAAFAIEVSQLPRLEGRTLAALIGWLRREARREPLGPTGLFSVIHRIQAEARDLRLILHGILLGAPAPALEAAMVTPG